jgi:chaperonin GroES
VKRPKHRHEIGEIVLELADVVDVAAAAGIAVAAQLGTRRNLSGDSTPNQRNSKEARKQSHGINSAIGDASRVSLVVSGGRAHHVQVADWHCRSGSANFHRNPSRGNAMKLRPLQDRVLIRRVEQEAKTSGGIIIPDTAQEKPMEGEVVAAGPGARDENGTLHPLDVKAGDRVLFGKWSGAEIKLDGEDLLIVKESDIMGVIDKGAAKKQAA